MKTETEKIVINGKNKVKKIKKNKKVNDTLAYAKAMALAIAKF